MTDALDQYYREVKRLLPCSAVEKKRCMEELRNDITAYLEHTPDASTEDVYATFGTPQSIAESFMGCIDPEQFSHKISAKRKIVIGVIAIVAALAIVVGVIAVLFTNTLQDFYDGYYVDDVIEYETLPPDAENNPTPIIEY